MKRYGYVRVSTMKQSIERQIRNIKAEYPDAIIVTDEITGTKLDRPGWQKVYKAVKPGDVIVFDSVSRMSRDAEEGFQVYEELFTRGVELIFLKEPHINTATYKRAMQSSVPLTGTKVDLILKGVNEYLLALAKEQIQLAFDQAEKEVMDLRQRTREGIETARLAGHQIGQREGATLEIKKKGPIFELIRKYSQDFDGDLDDVRVMSILKDARVKIETGKTVAKLDDSGEPVKDKDGKVVRVPEIKEISAKLARGTYYKYKRELRAALSERDPDEISTEIRDAIRDQIWHANVEAYSYVTDHPKYERTLASDYVRVYDAFKAYTASLSARKRKEWEKVLDALIEKILKRKG